jgi:hypothetical protein
MQAMHSQQRQTPLVSLRGGRRSTTSDTASSAKLSLISNTLLSLSQSSRWFLRFRHLSMNQLIYFATFVYFVFFIPACIPMLTGNAYVSRPVEV